MNLLSPLFLYRGCDTVTSDKFIILPFEWYPHTIVEKGKWNSEGVFARFSCRAPEVLKALAPGSQPPFLIFNGEVKTDTNKIEEFLEEKLAPPQWANGYFYPKIPGQPCFNKYVCQNRYPKLCCTYKESNLAGEDIFRKFSAYIKNPSPGLNNSEFTFKECVFFFLISWYQRLRSCCCFVTIQCWRSNFLQLWWSWTCTLRHLFLTSWSLIQMQMSLHACIWMETPLPWQTATCFQNSTLYR